MSNKEPTRVILWSIPRTLSTVFEKCIAYIKDVQIINEPYASACYFGPESSIVQRRGPDVPSHVEDILKEPGTGGDSKPGWFQVSTCTYQWVKDTLDANYSGKSLIFSKNMAHVMTDRFDMLPSSGYRHTFIIRHPHKLFPSWKGITQKFIQNEGEAFRLQDVPEPVCPRSTAMVRCWI